MATERPWKPIYNKIILLHQQNLTNAQIGERLGISAGTVSQIKCSETFKKKMVTLDQSVSRALTSTYVKSVVINEARKVLEESSKQAALMVRRLAKHGTNNDRVKLDACKDILERVGLSAPQITHTIKTDYNYSPEDVRKAAETLAEVTELTNRLPDGEGRFVLNDLRKKEVTNNGVCKKDETGEKGEEIVPPVGESNG